jgi:hypothetical protein
MSSDSAGAVSDGTGIVPQLLFDPPIQVILASFVLIGLKASAQAAQFRFEPVNAYELGSFAAMIERFIHTSMR